MIVYVFYDICARIINKCSNSQIKLCGPPSSTASLCHFSTTGSLSLGSTALRIFLEVSLTLEIKLSLNGCFRPEGHALRSLGPSIVCFPRPCETSGGGEHYFSASPSLACF